MLMKAVLEYVACSGIALKWDYLLLRIGKLYSDEGEEGRGILSLFLFKTSTQPWMRNEIASLRFRVIVMVTQDRIPVNHLQR